MTTQFNSFDRSPAGAFVESRAGARNKVYASGTGAVDPIIFIIGSARSTTIQPWIGWTSDTGWTWRRQLGLLPRINMHYTDNPGSFADDLEALQVQMAAHENFNYRAVGKNKPNWQIWLWQPRGMHLVDTQYLYSTGDRPFPSPNTEIVPTIDGVNSSVFLIGDDYPDPIPEDIARVFPLPIETADFRLPVLNTQDPDLPSNLIVGYVSGFPGSSVALNYPPTGTLLEPWTTEWRQHRESLIPAWETVMAGHTSLTPFFRNVSPEQNRCEVTMKLQREFRDFLIRPFTSATYGRFIADTPASAVKERMRDDLPEGVEELRVSTGDMNPGGRWLDDAKFIIQRRMR